MAPTSSAAAWEPPTPIQPRLDQQSNIARAAAQYRNGKGCVILATGNDDPHFVNFYAAHPDVIAVKITTRMPTPAIPNPGAKYPS